jgi:hypothetical protein
MENVVLNGFNKSPGDLRSIIVRLADCGASKFVSLSLALTGNLGFKGNSAPRDIVLLIGFV